MDSLFLPQIPQQRRAGFGLLSEGLQRYIRPDVNPSLPRPIEQATQPSDTDTDMFAGDDSTFDDSDTDRGSGGPFPHQQHRHRHQHEPMVLEEFANGIDRENCSSSRGLPRSININNNNNNNGDDEDMIYEPGCGKLLCPKDGPGGMIPPSYEYDGSICFEKTRGAANRLHSNPDKKFVRLEGKWACSACQKAARKGWKGGVLDYIGCWVEVPLDWVMGDPFPRHALGGCGECRGRGKGSKRGGCSLNHEIFSGKPNHTSSTSRSTSSSSSSSTSFRGPPIGPAKGARSRPALRNVIPRPAPGRISSRRSQRPSRRYASYASVDSEYGDGHDDDDETMMTTTTMTPDPDTQDREEHLDYTEQFYQLCLHDPDDARARRVLAMAISKISRRGWSTMASGREWYPLACKYLLKSGGLVKGKN